MTSPALSTTAYPIPVGGQQVRITDGAQSPPAGLSLVNRGDNGGTVWISAGPTGQSGAVPLGPGASLQWTDAATAPYAYLATSATKPETLVVTGQAQQYSNPTVVAAATASQLAAQGVPNVLVSTPLGSGRIQPGQSGSPIAVGGFASLVVNVSWNQPTPLGCNVLRLVFDDPANPALAPTSLFLTTDNVVDQAGGTWEVPVTAARVTLTNLQPPDNNNSPADVAVTGTNRAAAKLRQLGNELGALHYFVGCPTGGTNYLLTPADDVGTSPELQPQSRMNGPVTVSVWLTGVTTGYLFASYVHPGGKRASQRYRCGGVDTLFTVGHPTVPVKWSFTPDTSVAGAACRLQVDQA